MSYGGGIIANTLKFLFPKSEISKQDASRGLTGC
jgi:hypothetical protein